MTRTASRLIVYGAVALVVCGIALLVAAAGCASAKPDSRPMRTTSHAPNRSCNRPAPATARGYAAMFAHTPLNQWGGGDVAITVTLGNRHVWLFGDTLSTSRFVHSTAITQDGGCLHVSHRGAQLLPNSRGAWWWIESATRTATRTIRIKAEIVHRTSSGPWGFTTGRSRYALATVNTAGDVTFTRWLPGTTASDKPTGTLTRTAPGQVSYGRTVHRDIPIRGGHLVTVCRNWDDGTIHPLRTYAPLFTAGR